MARGREVFERARLYLVVTPSLCALGPAETAARAVEGGVDVVQLRDPEADDETFLQWAADLRDVCRERGVPFLLNDRVHLVEPSGADGVHVGQRDASPESVRTRLGDGVLVGLSTHNRAEVMDAVCRPVDYVGVGPVFETQTKSLERRPGGPDLVRDVAAAARLPWFAIGGIDATNLASVVDAGAARAAVSRAICSAADPRAAALRLKRRLGG
ncbi:MAG: thiamine phosphate synthase [Planctomycetota bacterium]